MPTPGNKYIKDGVTYTSSDSTMAMDYYNRAKKDGSHEKAAKEQAGGTYPESAHADLKYTKLPQHHLNANDKQIAASSAPKGSPLQNMLK